MFRIIGCPHLFCSLCISKHVEYKLQEKIIPICCPGEDCTNIIEPTTLGSIISPSVKDRWEEAIIESTIIIGCKKVHCPYEECSEVLISEYEEGIVVEECECPSCHRLFCANCRVPWHHGFDCKEFERLNVNKKEKEMLKVLARENNWRKCPNCKVFVDKTEGCIHITCRLVCERI
ncbi:E3 ubiquitin-protein ligase rnf144a [Phtheirospermum japonicum]|uniref:RBR-type E3 ubiquitin transferase n=1 Tax=Phtheirospermum japonicum TaxID=374723 RepID=A0A830CTK1_9LAMI|nr:E3 ubiquitin-protein ligase rnf144a [Phtheirospermum japonicum]